MLGSACVSLVCAAAIAMAPEAPSRATIVVTPLEVEGDVATAWRTSFADGLARGLGRNGATVTTSECSPRDSACLQRSETDAAFVVDAKVTKQDSDYTFTLILRSTTDGEELARTQQVCELCGLADAGAQLEDVAGTLASRVGALANAQALVSFESTPPGAQVVVDGQTLGTTPLSHELAPGEHQAEATAEGFVRQRRSFETEAAVDQTVRFELQPVPRDRSFLKPVGWASLGVGVAAVASGGVLVAIDEDPITSRCSGDNVNAAGICKYRRNTLAGGIALIALGSAAVVTGVVLLVRARRHERRSRVALTPAGLRF
jgi:hypothetical protein